MRPFCYHISGYPKVVTEGILLGLICLRINWGSLSANASHDLQCCQILRVYDLKLALKKG